MPDELGRFKPMDGMTPYTLGLLKAVQALAIVTTINRPEMREGLTTVLEHFLNDVPPGLMDDDAGAGSYRLPLQAVIKALENSK